MRLVTNKLFEAYIALKSRKRKFEDRWDSLDLDDVTTNVETPSDSEVDAAVRELDLVDDAIIDGGERKVKANGDIEVDNRMASLDIDDPAPRKTKSKSNTPDTADARTMGLEIDDNPSAEKEHPEDDWRLDYDLDDKSSVSSNSTDSEFDNAIGKLDYDDDVNTDSIVASVEDVYTAMASDNGETVKGLIKRYGKELTDVERLKEIMLAHAVNGNYNSLRAVCGDMTISLTEREKELGYIDPSEVSRTLKRLRKIARSLTGENNTYGLIPNAIANCTPETQVNYINVVDFLHEFLGIPVFPLFYRGAITLHCYDMASYLYDELPEGFIDDKLVFGKNGLALRIQNYNDAPEDIMVNVVKSIVPDNRKAARMNSSNLALLFNCCASNDKAFNMLMGRLRGASAKAALVYDYLEDMSNCHLSKQQMDAINNL